MIADALRKIDRSGCGIVDGAQSRLKETCKSEGAYRGFMST